MGAAQACCPAASAEAQKRFEKGAANDVSGGPLKDRRCTDILCLILFLAHYGVYLFVNFLGVSEGDPAKLYSYRDYEGQYCGIKEQWNGGLDLEKQDKLTYMMNVSAAAEYGFKQAMCSTVTEKQLEAIWGAGSTKMTEYRCACCKDPCGGCYTGSFDMLDLTSEDALDQVIRRKMQQLQNAASGSVFSTGGPNGDAFHKVFEQFETFFAAVCTTGCDKVTPSADRIYSYSPFPDDPMYSVYNELTTNPAVNSAIRDALIDNFQFKALPADICPYDARYCVPFPGVEFEEMFNGLCMFKLSASTIQEIGAGASAALESLGLDKIADSLSETFGTWTGDFVDTIDAFVVVAVCSFVIGFIFLVLLRFLVSCVIWTVILLVFLLFAAAGALCYVRHTQCRGTGLFESGHQKAIAVYDAGTSAVTGNSGSEEMSGNGANYRGNQWRTRSFRECQAWDSDDPQKTNYKSTMAAFANDGLAETTDEGNGYCRNPGGAADTIWCYTTDTEKRWEVCTPIGVVNPECPQGYEIESETMRKFLEILAFIIWGLALIWIIFIVCLCRQILLAIAMNKAAASFVATTPSILLVPIVQVFAGIVWTLAWFASFAFLLSQVSDGAVPTEYFETYAEAYGTEDDPGKCTGPWINGYVFKYAGNLEVDGDPCSGNKGDISGITPKCFGCYPPRFNVDWRVFLSFFTYLWTNAFLIALGQLIIAIAVAIWFFTMRPEKGRVVVGGKCRCLASSLRTAIWWSFRYHLGSLALGSFVVAVVQFVRYCLMYLERQAKAAKNMAMVWVLRATQCCLWCLEKCIRYLNKNAYIQIAILGRNFCTSAQTAFYLMWRNMARFAAVAALGSIINNVGVIFIMAATGVVGYFIMKGMHPDVTPVIPVIIYVLMAYVIAKLYLNVFRLAVDTMLQCFIVTEEMGGDGGWVPSELKNRIKEVDKIMAEDNVEELEPEKAEQSAEPEEAEKSAQPEEASQAVEPGSSAAPSSAAPSSAAPAGTYM